MYSPVKPAMTIFLSIGLTGAKEICQLFLTASFGGLGYIYISHLTPHLVCVGVAEEIEKSTTLEEHLQPP